MRPLTRPRGLQYPSPFQSSAASLLLFLAVWIFVGGAIALVALTSALHAGGRLFVSVEDLIPVGFFLFLFAYGVTYLICGRKILKGSRTAAIVALILSSAQLGVVALAIFIPLRQMTLHSGPPSQLEGVVAMCIYLSIGALQTMALIALLINLAKFLKTTGTNAGY